MRTAGRAEVDAHDVGVAVLAPLRELDEVAYLRYASVHQGFESLEDFEAAIALLRAEHAVTARARAALVSEVPRTGPRGPGATAPPRRLAAPARGRGGQPARHLDRRLARPCRSPASQPTPRHRRRPASAASSTPSTTSRRPSRCARSTVDATIAAVTGSPSTLAVNARSSSSLRRRQGR